MFVETTNVTHHLPAITIETTNVTHHLPAVTIETTNVTHRLPAVTIESFSALSPPDIMLSACDVLDAKLDECLAALSATSRL